MTSSRQTMLAGGVRVLACLLSAYGVLLLVDAGRPVNDAMGYALLVIGPLIMLGARWIDPPDESADSADGEASEDMQSSGTPSSTTTDKSDSSN